MAWLVEDYWTCGMGTAHSLRLSHTHSLTVYPLQLPAFCLQFKLTYSFIFIRPEKHRLFGCFTVAEILRSILPYNCER